MTTKYEVTVFSTQTGKAIRTIANSLSEVIQLTLGLECSWYYSPITMDYTQSPLYTCDELPTDYKHGLRALVQRWKRNYFEPVSWFRLSDSALFRIQSNARLNAAFDQ